MYFHPDFIKQLDIAVGTYLKGLSTKGIYAFQLYFSKLSDYTVNAVEHFVLAIVTYVLLCILLYVIINKGKTAFEKPIKNARRVLIVTAHPDDECMFFGPTIFKLTKAGCSIYLLCLSNGKNRLFPIFITRSILY